MYKEFSDLLNAYIDDTSKMRFHPVSDDIVVPIGTSVDQTYMESIVGNMLIYGGVGSGKTTIVTNIVEFLTMWYHPDVMDITVLSRYNRECLYTRDDNGKSILRNVVACSNPEEIGLFLHNTVASMNDMSKAGRYGKATVIVIDNLRDIHDIAGAMNNLKHLMMHGSEYGIHCIITADPFVGAEFVVRNTKHLIVLRCDPVNYSYLHSDRPLVELPSATGFATIYGKNVQTVCAVPMCFTNSTRANFFKCAEIDAGHKPEPRKSLEPCIF